MKNKTNWDKLKNMTDKDIDEAIATDPDAYAPTKKELKEFKRVHPIKEIDVKKVRQNLHLSQTKFALYFGVNARTIQEWEQKRSNPSPLARNFLRVVQYAPNVVQKALAEVNSTNTELL